MPYENNSAQRVNIKFIIFVVFFYSCAFILFTYPLVFRFTTHCICGTDPYKSPGGDMWYYLWTFWLYDKSIAEGKFIPYETDRIFYPEGIKYFYAHSFLFYYLLIAPFTKYISYSVLYNILVYFTYISAGLAMFFLCLKELKDKHSAFLAGYAFAFCPYHLTHSLGHITLINILWFPLIILIANHLFRNNRWSTAFALGAVFFISVFSCVVYPVMMAFLIAIMLLIEVLFNGWKTVKSVILKLTIIFLFLFIIIPFLIGERLKDFTREYVYFPVQGFINYSAGLLNYFIPSKNHFLLSKYLQKYYLFSFVETTVFMGISIFILSIIGLIKGNKEQKKWAVIALIFFIISLGPFLKILNKWEYNIAGYKFTIKLPYYILAYVPVLKGIRAPARYSIVFMTFAVLLASYGFKVLFQNWQGKNRAIALLAILAIITIEFLSIPVPLGSAVVPQVYYLIKEDPRNVVVLDLPFIIDQKVPQYYQTVHQKPLLCGHLARIPEEKINALKLDPFISFLLSDKSKLTHDDYPSIASLMNEFIKKYQIGYIVFHKGWAKKEEIQFYISFLDHFFNNVIFAKDENTICYQIK